MYIYIYTHMHIYVVSYALSRLAGGRVLLGVHDLPLAGAAWEVPKEHKETCGSKENKYQRR